MSQYTLEKKIVSKILLNKYIQLESFCFSVKSKIYLTTTLFHNSGENKNLGEF